MLNDVTYKDDGVTYKDDDVTYKDDDVTYKDDDVTYKYNRTQSMLNAHSRYVASHTYILCHIIIHTMSHHHTYHT